MNYVRSICLALIFLSTSAWSQSTEDVDWKITPYLWLVNLDGTLNVGPIEQDIDASFGDIVSNLDFAGEIYAEVGKGHHAFHIDYTYMRLKPDPTPLETPPFPPNAELATKMTINLFEAAYQYRWKGPQGPALVLGARLTDMDIKLTPTNLPSVNAGPSWWDYFAGIKTYNIISPKWDFSFYGTVGTGGSDLPWTTEFTFGRRYSNDNRLILGARVWGIDYDGTDRNIRTELDLTYYGLMVGYEFN